MHRDYVIRDKVEQGQACALQEVVPGLLLLLLLLLLLSRFSRVLAENSTALKRA